MTTTAEAAVAEFNKRRKLLSPSAFEHRLDRSEALTLGDVLALEFGGEPDTARDRELAEAYASSSWTAKHYRFPDGSTAVAGASGLSIG